MMLNNVNVHLGYWFKPLKSRNCIFVALRLLKLKVSYLYETILCCCYANICGLILNEVPHKRRNLETLFTAAGCL